MNTPTVKLSIKHLDGHYGADRGQIAVSIISGVIATKAQNRTVKDTTPNGQYATLQNSKKHYTSEHATNYRYRKGREMSINSRAKGAAGERELANILKQYGFETRRGQQYCGANGDADIVGLKNIHIEAKRVEHLNIEKAMEQSRADAGENEVPIVAHRKNRQPWLVTMDLEDWITLYRSWICQQNET